MLLVLYLSLEYLYAVGSQYTFYGSLNKLHQNNFSFSFQNQFFLYGGKTGGTQVRIALELAINSFHNFVRDSQQKYIQDPFYQKTIKYIGATDWYRRIDEYQSLCKDQYTFFLSVIQ